MPRAFELEEILTEEQIALAVRLYKTGKRKFYANCLAQITKPAHARIIEVLGPCDLRYVTYGIEYRCLKMRKQRKKGKNKTDYFFRGSHRGRPTNAVREQRVNLAKQIQEAENRI